MKRVLFAFAVMLTTISAAMLTGCGSPSPRKIADRQGLAFGIAVQTGDILSPNSVEFIKRHFNLIVPTDTTKWVNIHPTRKFWNWSDTDAMVAFAEKHGMQMKGHCFLWQDQNAPYVHSAKTREQAIELLTEQITGVMTRYKGKIGEYDVANEILNEDGTMRDTMWYRLIGPDFLDIAFKAAHDADPQAKLVLADYNTEYAGTAKGDSIYEIVKDLKARGVPIDGIAHQLHCMADVPFDEEALRKNVKRYNELGVYSSFSEVDVRIKMPVDGDDEERQCDIYARLMNVARTEPGVGSMILWGYTDKTSWIPRAFPGYGSATILDMNMEPKAAYRALMDALAGKWEPKKKEN